MKTIILLLFASLFFSCNSSQKDIKKLEARLDSVQKNAYKPGFGEFMSNIQVHHAKLWFAGQNNNWPLADFEIHEIMETVDALKKYQADRVETNSLSMIQGPLDSVNGSIEKKDPLAFKNSFVLLTNTDRKS